MCGQNEVSCWRERRVAKRVGLQKVRMREGLVEQRGMGGRQEQKGGDWVKKEGYSIDICVLLFVTPCCYTSLSSCSVVHSILAIAVMVVWP